MALTFVDFAAFRSHFLALDEVVGERISNPIIVSTEYNDPNVLEYEAQHIFIVAAPNNDSREQKVRYWVKKSDDSIRVQQDPFTLSTKNWLGDGTQPYQESLYQQVGVLNFDFGSGSELLVGANFSGDGLYVDERSQNAVALTQWKLGTTITERLIFVYGKPIKFATLNGEVPRVFTQQN